MANLMITLTKSTIGSSKKQIATIEAIGLKKIRDAVEKQDTPQLRGMLKVVSHLVEVQEI